MLLAEVASMRAVVEAAERWDRFRRVAGVSVPAAVRLAYTALQDALDAYRALTPRTLAAALADAPIDDEPLTADDDTAESWDDVRAGRVGPLTPREEARDAIAAAAEMVTAPTGFDAPLDHATMSEPLDALTPRQVAREAGAPEMLDEGVDRERVRCARLARSMRPTRDEVVMLGPGLGLASMLARLVDAIERGTEPSDG